MEESKQDRANSPWVEENRVCESDIFISYAHADDADGFVTGLVQWLEEELSTFASFDVCFVDRKDIQFMDDWEAKISEGLRSSRLLVALVSPNYFLSPFCRKEWQEYQELGSEEALLAYTNTAAVLQIEACEPLENRERLNRQQLLERFISLGQEQGIPEQRLPTGDAATAEVFEDWVRGIGRIQLQTLAEWRTKGPDILKEAKVRERLKELSRTLRRAAGRREARRKSFTNVPPHNPKFRGRVRELRELRDALAVRKREGTIALLNGAMPGIGKSALAFEYAHVFAPEYMGGRFHIRAEGLTELAAALEQLEAPLGLELETAQRADSYKLINAVGRALHEREGKALLLFDNLDDPGVLDGAANLIGADQVHILITTRLPEERFSGWCHCIPVGPIAVEDGTRLLAAHRTPADQSEWDAAREIARRLDGYPLALELVAVTLQHPRRRQRFEDYLDEMIAGGLDLTLRESGTTLEAKNIPLGRRPREETRILQALLEPVLGSLTPAQYETLALAAHLPPDTVPLPWLQALIAENHPETASLKPHQEGAWENSILDVLAALHLLVPYPADGGAEPRLGRIHRVLADLVTGREEREATIHRRACILAHANSRSRELDSEDVSGRWEIAPLFETAQILASDTDRDMAETIAIILIAVGDAFFKIQEFRRSLKATSQAEHLLRRLLKTESRNNLRVELAGSLNNLGLTLRALQRFRDSLDRFAEAERFFRSLVKEEGEQYHFDLATSLTNKAMALGALRRLPEALRVLEEAETFFCSLINLEASQYRAQLAQCIGNKGIVLRDLKRFSAALKAFEATEKLLRPLVEEDGRTALRAEYAKCLTNKGQVLNDLMNFSEALKAHEAAVTFFRLLAEAEKRNEYRVHLAESLIYKGAVLSNLRRFPDAFKSLKESEGIFRTLVEKEGRIEFCNGLAMSSIKKGRVLLALRNLPAALRMLEEVEHIFRGLVKDEGQINVGADLAKILADKGSVLLELQRTSEALRALEEAEEIFRPVLAEQPQTGLRADLAICVGNKGGALLALNSLPEALKALEEAENILRLLVKKGARKDLRPDFAINLSRKGFLLHDLRDFPKALKALKQAENILRQLFKTEGGIERSIGLATSLSVKGSVLSNLRRFCEALKALEEAENIFHSLIYKEGRNDLIHGLAHTLRVKKTVLLNL